MSESQSSDDFDSDPWSLFSYTHEAKQISSSTFWEGVTHVVGANTLGRIALLSGLGGGVEDQLKPPGQNNGGLRYCHATPNGSGWNLTGSFTKGHDEAVPIYWVPWKSGETVYAERSWFENSICDYFLTAQLSGCRFVLTKTQVLHIASDVNGATSGATFGSMLRTRAEHAVTGGVPSRRLSFNGGDMGYQYLALVFGIRCEGNIWKYKALRYRPGEAGGEWITLIAPS